MLSSLLHFFIPEDKRASVELLRRYRLVVSIMLLTALFDLNYAGITILIGLEEGIAIMLLAALLHLLLPFLLKAGLPLIAGTYLYILTGVMAVTVCIYYSGGFYSPVLPWLATSPVVALLMGGRRTGLFWMLVNSGIVCWFGVRNTHYAFPSNYDHSWDQFFYLNCFVGLVVIVFVVALVFENGKNTAFRELAEKNLLLAEEKKKLALQDISREIHDNIGQTLSLAKLHLHTMQMLSGGRAEKKLAEVLELVAKAIQDLRGLSNKIHSDNITEFDLVETLRNELDMIGRIGRYTTELEVKGIPFPLSPQTALILYRISQEILHNIIKHAGATAIGMRIDYEPQQFVLNIRDNGKGFDCEDFMQKGQGFRNMQNRAQLLGGQLLVDSGRRQGTKVSIRLPKQRAFSG